VISEKRGGRDERRARPLHDPGRDEQHRVAGEARPPARASENTTRPTMKMRAAAQHVGGAAAEDQQAR